MLIRTNAIATLLRPQSKPGANPGCQGAMTPQTAMPHIVKNSAF